MLKRIVLPVALLASSLAFAQERGPIRVSGDFPVLDGSIRIQIGDGDGRDTRDLARRVRSLEQAVADLQQRLYQGEGAPAEFVCTVTENFNNVKPYIGKGPTKTEAGYAAKMACLKEQAPAFCTQAAVCE